MEKMVCRDRDLQGDVIRSYEVNVILVAEMVERNIKIRDWYMKEFPSDSLGQEIDSSVSFQDLFNALDDYKDVYAVIGVGDSVIRERCFEKLAEIMGVDYGYVYDQWLKSARY